MRSGDWKAAAKATDFPGPPGAPVDVEGAQLAELRPGRLAGGGGELAGADALVDDEREVLLDRPGR